MASTLRESEEHGQAEAGGSLVTGMVTSFPTKWGSSKAGQGKTLREPQEHEFQASGSSKVKVTILAFEWGSSKGELSTLNRELAIQLAKYPDVQLTFFLPKCNEEDKEEALSHNITIVQATGWLGFEELEWLSLPPEHLQIDVVIGHGVELGHHAQVIRNSYKCKWVQVVHTNHTGQVILNVEELSLCQMADFVVNIVGSMPVHPYMFFPPLFPKLTNVLSFTPGVLDEFKSVKQIREERKHHSILVFGPGGAKDCVSMGIDIAAKAVAAVPDTHLAFVGAPDTKHDEIVKHLLNCGIPENRLIVESYVKSRERLKHLFCGVDLVLMPSRTEGFGLTGLEALSAGLPVLVSKTSGFGQALSKVPFGSSFVIDSNDPKVWAAAIKHIWNKDRLTQLEEAEALRDIYDKKYSWAKQCRDLHDKIINLVVGMNNIHTSFHINWSRNTVKPVNNSG